MDWQTFLEKQNLRLLRLGVDLSGINTVRFHPREHFRHRLVKFLICNHLFELKRNFKTEQLVKSTACDVLDLQNMVVYEIEGEVTNMKLKEKVKRFCKL